MSERQIVYPDPDSPVDAVFSEDRLVRIRALGTFHVYEDMPRDEDVFIERVRHANAVILGWKLPDSVLEEMRETEIIAFTGIGAASMVNLPMARAQGITVTNTPGYANNTVAEHTIALMLSLSRQVPRLDRDMRSGGWN